MPDTDLDRAVGMFSGLDQNRQAALLKQMSPEQKQKLLTGLRSRNTNLEFQKQKLASDFDKANPGSAVTRDAEGQMHMEQPGTLASRTREAAIGLLQPFTIPNIATGLKDITQAQYDIMRHPLTRESYQPAIDIATGMVKAPIQPVKDIYQGVATGNYEQAAGGAGGFASQTVPAIEGAASAVKGLKTAGALRDQARRGAQSLTSSSAFKTTEPAIAEYGTKLDTAAAQQIEADRVVAAKNREAQQAAAGRTARAQEKVTQSNEAAMNEADISTEQRSQNAAEANRRAIEQHQQETAAVNAHNANVKQLQQQAQTLDSNLREGSKQFGESIVDLNKKLTEEGNAKYAKVNTAVENDPGIPAPEMAQAAAKARDLLKGSSENIKQIRELSQEADEGQADIQRLESQGVSKATIADLIEKGVVGTGEAVKFDDLRGYSTELGAKLAKGGLLPDVYQALTSLKESIDLAKEKIAARNNVLPELKDADTFWHKKLSVMKDKSSAVADVRGRVGTLDPEFYSEPFTKGKASGVGAQMLRDLPTEHGDLARSIADQGERLRQYYADRKALKIPAEKPLPAPPTQRAAGPRQMATLQPVPEPVEPKLRDNVVITKPKAPTAEQIVADKRARIEAKGRSIAEISKYDAGTIAAVPISAAFGHPLAGFIPLASKYGLSFLLTRPSVIEWIARPTTADLAAVSKLPPAEAATLKAGLQQVIDQQRASGKPIMVSQKVMDILKPVSGAAAVAGAAQSPVQNRRDALRLLNRPAL